MRAEERLEAMRDRMEELSAIHASLPDGHMGWANCHCSLAQLLRKRSEAAIALATLIQRGRKIVKKSA